MEALEGGGRTQPQTAVELYVTSVCACVCVCVSHVIGQAYGDCGEIREVY
jgi:hypothetical protein